MQQSLPRTLCESASLSDPDIEKAADGNWGADSVEALKRFQRDQNLTKTGNSIVVDHRARARIAPRLAWNRTAAEAALRGQALDKQLPPITRD